MCGVRVYTQFMSTSKTTIRLAEKQPRVVIDWSDLSSLQNSEGMIDWVRQYPQQKDIHVYLRSAGQRQLKNTLQSLGCTVTMRLAGVA